MENETNEARRDQARLQESVERLQLTLQATHQGWFDINLSTGDAVVNEQYAIMLGYDPVGFTENLDAWYRRVNPDDLLKVWEVYRDYVGGRRPDYRVEFRERTRGGEWIWILSLGAVVAYDAQARPLRLVGTRLDITDRKEVERLQREADRRISFTLDAAKLGDFTLDLRSGVIDHSMQHDRCFGYTEPIVHWDYQVFLSHIVDEDRDPADSIFQAALALGQEYEIEYRARWPDGTIHWLWSKGSFSLNEDGTPESAVGVVGDITQRKKAEATAQAGERRYRLLLENSVDAIFQLRSDGRIMSANAAACTMFGATLPQLLASHCDDIVDTSDPRWHGILQDCAATGHARAETRMIRKDGASFEAEATTAIYSDHDGALITSLMIRDITERKKAAAEIDRLAYYDQLTGLPNRRWLIDHLELARERVRDNQSVDALFFLDLDHFKIVNDVRGHAVGDTLLQHIAERLEHALAGRGTVARLGGDEFVIHAANVANTYESGAAAALELAQELAQAVLQPVEIHDQVYSSTGSIGVTLFPRDQESVDDLLREADTAMYRAKSAGRNRIAVFEPGMRSELEFRLRLERDLAAGLRRDELLMHCQPQVNRSGDVVGAELLLTWQNGTRGPVSPAVFIPLAEESDLIIKIGRWVIDAACRIEVETRARGLDLPISVNISPKQFRHPAFVAEVRKTVELTGARAPRLIFEVTEGLLIEDVDEVVERMHALRALGIRFSIDDFGTGYSSLAYLRQLPLYELKIDKRFVQELPENTDDIAIVQSMLSIAKHMQLRVVAEGVETREQADFLRGLGCDCLQGYLFGRPMPLRQFLEL